MKIRLLLIILFFCWQNIVAQTGHWDVMLFGKDVGDVTASRTVSGNVVTIDVVSDVTVNYILGKRHEVFVGKTIITDGYITSATVDNTKNGKKNYFCYTTFMETGYKVQTEKGLSTIAGKLKNSVYMLFFEEPVGISSVYNERFGFSGVLVKKAEHSYKLEMAGEDDYTYHFEKGELVKMEFPSPLGNGYFKKR